MLVWMDEKPMQRDQQYFIKQTTNTTRVHIDQIKYKVDVNTMEQSMAETMSLNEIARAVFVSNKPLFFDSYKQNKNCGSFILIDPITNNTSAVGMIIDEVNSSDLSSAVTEEDRKKTRDGISLVSDSERERLIGQAGKLFIIAGNNLSVQRECAYLLERRLFDTGHFAIVLDAQKLGIDGKSQTAAFAAIATELTRKGIITICIDLYGEITVDNAFTIAIAEDSIQPVDKNKDYCTVCQQHLAATIEDIINIKL